MSTGRGERFRYEGWTWDDGTLSCTYSLDGRTFTERIGLDGAPAEPTPQLAAAARLVFLLAGISYYKTGAPPVVDLGEHAVTDLERDFLRTYYVKGLGEFAHKNGLLHELQDLRLEGPTREPAPAQVPPSGRPLVPFGGGIDSIVVVEETRKAQPDLALFVASRAAARFEAIEAAAAVTGLPVRRADREVDAQVLRSAELGFLNGHVPVTGILSATAVLAALVDGRDSVVMSNEWSASSGTVQVDGIDVNHQWSKSIEFERGFREVLAQNLPGFDYHSALRPYSELWVAQRFAELERYHLVFRSCNRAFHLDPARRADRWCGRCDKCCFIDLVLAPFLPRERLEQVFDGAEPLAQEDLADRFRSLLGDPALTKPFECVGDVDECRVAVITAAERPDRQETVLLQRLAAQVRAGSPLPATPLPELGALLRPLSESFAPQHQPAP
ncbi:MAG: endonuclease domain-containing protein [Motilibacteraceae bacterium]